MNKINFNQKNNAVSAQMENFASKKWKSVEPDNSTKTEIPQNFTDFNTIVDKTDIPILTHLNSTNPEAKAEFLADSSLERPRNEWKKLDPARYERNLLEIEKTESELDKTTKLNFREKLLLKMEFDFSKKKNRLALATARYNSATTTEEKQIAEQNQRIANAELYGMPDKDVFYSLLAQKMTKIDLESLSEENRQKYSELQKMLGELPKTIKPLYEPKQETIDRFGAMAKKIYEPFLKHIPENQEIFTAQDAANIVNRALSEEVGKETDWHAKVKPNSGLASVGTESKTVNFPGARSKGDYTKLDLEKIIAHELGTHALRSMVYDDSTIRAFRSITLEGVTDFEEGIAKVMEQSIEGKFDDPESPAPSRYIMIGLANFYHTNFRETFEIMKRLESLTNGWNEGQIYDNLQRVYRGTGVLPNNKDLAYYNGNVSAWKFIEKNIDDPMLFDRIFLSGKTDPQNPVQEYLSYEMKTGAMER